ncbi:Uncharacterised protein [Mycobacteroides abscessus subsp. abscessus]|nr:Uncharacterised protein [Mycobacteroides abscessus subsp. abscessus]
MPGHLHTGLLHLDHAALHRVLRQLGLPEGIGIAALDLVAHLIQGWGVPGGRQLTHGPQRGGHLLLHLGLLQLAQQLGALGDALLQHHRVLLDGLLGLGGRGKCLIVQGLEVLDALLGGDQLSGEGLGRVVVLGCLRGIAGGGRLIGQGQRLTHIDL